MERRQEPRSYPWIDDSPEGRGAPLAVLRAPTKDFADVFDRMTVKLRKAFRHCICDNCSSCPYEGQNVCMSEMFKDALFILDETYFAAEGNT